MNMAAEVRNMLAVAKVMYIDRPNVLQLIRCSSSVAANYRAATRSRSDAEFFSKICIVVEETDETLFWLEYMITIRVLDAHKTENLRQDIEKLIRLFSSIKQKMKTKLRK